MKKIVRGYYEQLYANRLDNIDEMDKFLETQNLQRLNHKEIGNLHIPITTKVTESFFKSLRDICTPMFTAVLPPIAKITRVH